jgi:site-specific DNA recombinase
MNAEVVKPGSIEGAAAVIYVRVSSKEQAEKGGETEGYSIPAQREACKRKASSLQTVVLEEFIERGESAKTADRPELQRMLDFIREQPVKYVIVHKVDRLARNRADDVAINLAIHQAGAELVSVSENIDQTPSGLLLHGIMSSIAEFYSRNLATEVIKGSVQKAKNGGTPGRAPIGYSNVRRMVDGREIRTVEVDPLRGPLMAWAFEAYATGDWTIRRLLDELTARGLTTVPGKRGPGKPLEVSHLHRLLRHPYYIGVVRYRDVLYPGKHEALTTPEIWHEVQKLLSAKNYAGEKQRKYPHYLKGSIYCGQCGSRLIVCHASGRGGTYPYFICIGRQQKRTSCTQRAIRIEQAEAAVAAHYATVQLSEAEVERLEVFLGEELAKLRADADRDRTVEARRLRQLEAERKKLLDAYFADAIQLDLLKREQDRLGAQIASAEGRLAEVESDFQTAETNLQRVLKRVGDCAVVYGGASGKARRQLNLAFFTRLLLDDEGSVAGELAEPFSTILGEELRRAAVAQADVELREAVDEALRRRTVDDVPTGGEKHQNPDSFRSRGLNEINLVRSSGLEPPRAVKPTRPSTLRVYQFRHERRVREYSLAPVRGIGACAPGRRVVAPRSNAIALAAWKSATCVRPQPTLQCEHVFVSAPPSSQTGSPADMDLTKRQQEIFDFIRKYSAKYGYPPTVRDIGKAVGLASSSTVHAHLANLEKLGLLRRDPSKPRAIELLDRAMGSAVETVRGIVRSDGLPLLGSVAAGQPMLAEENVEDYVSVPEIAGGADGEYLLRIRGDSMKEAGIIEGDFVVVRPQDTARDGDVVVALLGEEATVKRFFKESDHIRLQPENVTMEPIRSKEVTVLGRVVGLLRSV